MVSIHHSIMYKRLQHFGFHLLDQLENKELKWYNQIVKKNPVKLDLIKKKPLSVPQALFPLKNVPLEWWYFTGHLEEKAKKNKINKLPQKFGYEFCFFKFHPQALRLGPIPVSLLRKEPFLVFHFALTDKTNSNFHFEQEAGVIHPQKIDYNKINLQLNHSFLKFNKNFILKTKNKIGELELKLSPLKKIVKHFDHGYIEMYPHPSSRTYYLTYPRLKTEGLLKYNHKEYLVSGLSWFDHQKVNLPHKTTLLGWDWFSLILDDKTELMLFLLRTKKGWAQQSMGGTYIKSNSQTINLSPGDFSVKVLSHWTSPQNKIIYPSEWEVQIPKLKLKLKVLPAVKDQELSRTVPISYWEGACDVFGTKDNKPITGLSYVELVGYDRRLITEILKKNLG